MMLYVSVIGHGDHYARLNEILPEIPVYMSDLSRKIIERVFCFSKTKGKFTRDTIDFQEETPIFIGDMKITAYRTDHSWFDSYMILVEAEGKKLLYTGDWRNSGFKGALVEKVLRKIGKVDVLVTEGTQFNRKQIKNQTESDLTLEMIEKTKKYNQVLLLCSTTNIDRAGIVMTKVGNKTNKTVVQDILLANVLSVLPHRVPNPANAEDIYCFLPSYYYRKRNIDEYKPYIEPFKEKISKTGRKLHRRFYYEYQSIGT